MPPCAPPGPPPNPPITSNAALLKWPLLSARCGWLLLPNGWMHDPKPSPEVYAGVWMLPNPPSSMLGDADPLLRELLAPLALPVRECDMTRCGCAGGGAPLRSASRPLSLVDALVLPVLRSASAGSAGCRGEVGGGDSSVSVLMPGRERRGWWAAKAEPVAGPGAGRAGCNTCCCCGSSAAAGGGGDGGCCGSGTLEGGRGIWEARGRLRGRSSCCEGRCCCCGCCCAATTEGAGVCAAIVAAAAGFVKVGGGMGSTGGAQPPSMFSDSPRPHCMSDQPERSGEPSPRCCSKGETGAPSHTLLFVLPSLVRELACVPPDHDSCCRCGA